MELDIKKHVESLPEEMISAITETPIESILTEIRAQFHIPLDKAGILETEIRSFIYGLSDTSAFDAFITRFDGVSPENRAHLRVVLNEELFDVIRKKYESYQEEDVYENDFDDFGDTPISELDPADYGLTLEDLDDEEEEAPKMITERMHTAINNQTRQVHSIPTVDPYREPIE